MEELKEPVKNSELHINAQNYPEGCYEELEKLKKEYQSQYADIESKHKDFHGRDDRSAKELMDLTVAFRKRIKTIRDKYNVQHILEGVSGCRKEDATKHKYFVTAFYRIFSPRIKMLQKQECKRKSESE